MATLTAPHPRFEVSYRAAMDEYVAESRTEELRSLPDHSTFSSFTQELLDHAEGKSLPSGWVAMSTFWLVEGGEFIGTVEVRHELTDALRRRGGHVGYSVRPTMRRRGYGRRALALALPRCRDLGLSRVLVTCDTTNTASRRIIEANGGELDGITRLDGRPAPTMRFWIDVPPTLFDPSG